MKHEYRDLAFVCTQSAPRRPAANAWMLAGALGLLCPAGQAAPQSLFETQGQVLIGPGTLLPAPGHPPLKPPGFGLWTAARADDGSALMTLSEGSGDGTAGLYRWSEAAGLVRLLGTGSPIPGGSPDPVTVGLPVALSPGIRVSASGQQILFGARLAGPAVDQSSDSALYLWSNGSPQLLVREGFAAPGIPGGIIGSPLEQLFPELAGLSENGTCSFRVRLAQGGAVGPNNDGVIYRGSPGNLQVVAREGSALPTGEQLDELNASAAAPASPVHRLDAAGNLLFDCRLLAGSSATPVTVDNDQAVLLSRPGQALSVLMREGDPSPYPGTRFGSLLGIWIRILGSGPLLSGLDPGAVFMTSLSGSSSPPAGPEALVVARASGTTPLARIGDPIAGLPGISLATFNILTFAHDAFGRASFAATLGGTQGPQEDTAILSVEPGGPIEVLAREGDIAPGTGGQRFVNLFKVLTLDSLGRTWFSASLGGDFLDSWWVHDPALGLRLVARVDDTVAPPSGQEFAGQSWSLASQWTTTGRPTSITPDGRALTLVAGKTSFSATLNLLAYAAIGTQTLSSSTPTLSIAAGGSIGLPLQAGSRLASQLYLVLGSFSGAAPGLPTDAGLLPLNPDALSTAMLSQANQGPFQGNLGLLSDGGTAAVGLQVPAGLASALIGQTLTFAGLTIETQGIPRVTFVTNAALVQLVP
jgi:hypothetical protein